MTTMSFLSHAYRRLDEYLEEEAEKVCKVYDSDDFFTIAVQLMLAAFALGSLWFKRQSETPRRKFRTWFLDVSKQAVGACYAHVCNMAIAAIIVGRTSGETELKDQCAWYGISYLIDTTLGLVLAIGFLKGLDYLAHENDWVSLKHSGVYEGVDGLLHWVHQVFAWVLILTVVKIIIYFFMVGASSFLAALGSFLFQPFQGNIRFELLFVMIFFPGFLNVIYFWIADSFMQASKEHAGAHEEEDGTEMAAKSESLLTDGEKQMIADGQPPKEIGGTMV